MSGRVDQGRETYMVVGIDDDAWENGCRILGGVTVVSMVLPLSNSQFTSVAIFEKMEKRSDGSNLVIHIIGIPNS